jgi:hypothetical protein
MNKNDLLGAPMRTGLIDFLGKTVGTTVHCDNVSRVHIGATDAVLSFEAKFNMVLSNLGGVRPLPNPGMPINFVFANGVTVVKEKRARRWRRRWVGGLETENVLILDQGDDFVNGQPTIPRSITITPRDGIVVWIHLGGH